MTPLIILLRCRLFTIHVKICLVFWLNNIIIFYNSDDTYAVRNSELFQTYRNSMMTKCGQFDLEFYTYKIRKWHFMSMTRVHNTDVFDYSFDDVNLQQMDSDTSWTL